MPHLLVIDLEPPRPSKPTSVSELHVLCVFHHSPIDDNIRVIDMLIRSDPVANWGPNPALDVPFSASRKGHLFVVTLWLAKYDDETAVLSLMLALAFFPVLATLAPGETRRELMGLVRLAAYGPGMHAMLEVRYPYGMAFGVVSPD